MNKNKGIIQEEEKRKGKIPEPGSKEFLDLSKYVKEIRGMYKEDLSQDTFNCILLGLVSSGKTTMAGTARKPILCHSFDPGGTKVFKRFNADNPGKPTRDLTETGEVIADTRFEGDDSSYPKAFKEWQAEFEKLRRKNHFQHFGTYLLDSFTTWLLALKYDIAKKKGRDEGVLAKHDWQVLGNIVRDTINVMLTLPCDVILTGHLTTEKDDVTGRITTKLDTIPSLQTDLPLLFDEIYCLKSEDTPKGADVKVVTRSTGKYQAGTRIGSGGNFDLYEEPNFKKLLAKANFPTEDKPLFGND